MIKKLIFLLLLPISVAAQDWDNQIFKAENNPNPPFYPFVVTGSFIDVQKTHFHTPGFKDDTLKYWQAEAAMAFTYPFNEYCGLIFGAGWVGTEVNMENNPNFHETRFDYVNLSIGGFTAAYHNWLWTLTFAAYLDAGHFSLIDYALYDGVLWGKYDFCDWIEFDFGLIVETGLHKEKVWPIIGFVYYPYDDWRISIVYPIDISVEYSFWTYWTAGGSLRFFRNRHRVGQGEPSPQSIFEYRTTGAELDLSFSPFDWFYVTAFAGSTFNGDLKVTNRNNRHGIHYKFNGSFYSGIEGSLSF